MVGFAVADTTLTEICSRYHATAFSTFVICSRSVVDRSIIERVGVETIKCRTLKHAIMWGSMNSSFVARSRSDDFS